MYGHLEAGGGNSPSQDVLPSSDVLRPAGQGWQVGLLVVLPVSMEASV
jgi:hypothetical protein